MSFEILEQSLKEKPKNQIKIDPDNDKFEKANRVQHKNLIIHNKEAKDVPLLDLQYRIGKVYLLRHSIKNIGSEDV